MSTPPDEPRAASAAPPPATSGAPPPDTSGAPPPATSGAAPTATLPPLTEGWNALKAGLPWTAEFTYADAEKEIRREAATIFSSSADSWKDLKDTFVDKFVTKRKSCIPNDREKKARSCVRRLVTRTINELNAKTPKKEDPAPVGQDEKTAKDEPNENAGITAAATSKWEDSNQEMTNQSTTSGQAQTHVPYHRYLIKLHVLSSEGPGHVRVIPLWTCVTWNGGNMPSARTFNDLSLLSFAKFKELSKSSSDEIIATQDIDVQYAYIPVTDDITFIAAVQDQIERLDPSTKMLMFFMADHDAAKNLIPTGLRMMHRMRLFLADEEMLDAIEAVKTEVRGHKRKHDEAFELPSTQSEAGAQDSTNGTHTSTPDVPPPPALDAQLPVQTDAESASHEQTETLTQEVQNADDEASVARVPSVAPRPPTPQPQPFIQVENKTPLDSENGAAAQKEPKLDEKPKEDEVVLLSETLRKSKEQILKEIADDPSLAGGSFCQLALTQFKDEHVAEYYAFFNLDPNTWSASKEMDVRGLRKAKNKEGKLVRIRGYQHFAGWWFITHELEWEYGGLFADEMGLGKTLTIIWGTVLYHLIINNQAELARVRAGKSKKQHLAPGEQGTCARSEHWGFRCACENKSFAAQKLPIAGATLVLAPTSVLDVWIEEFDKWVDPTVVQLRVIKAMGDARKRDPSTWKDEDDKRFLCTLPDMSKAPLIKDHLPYWHLDNWKAIMSTYKERAAATQTTQHGLVLVSTVDSIQSQVFKKFAQVVRPETKMEYQCNDKNLCPMLPENGECQSETHTLTNTAEATISKIQFARVWIDEAHKIRNSTHSIFKELKKRITNQWGWYRTDLCVWPVSGTPYPEGPDDYGMWVKFYDEDTRKTYDKQATIFRELGAKQEKLQSKDEVLPDDEESARRGAFMSITKTMETHVLRRDDDTKDHRNGNPLVEIPEMKQEVVHLDMTPNSVLDSWLKREREQWKLPPIEMDPKQRAKWMGAVGAELRARARLSNIYVSFPGLIKIDDPKYKGHTVKSIHKYRCWTSNNNPYYANLDDLAKSSPKFKRLIEFVRQRVKDKATTGKLIIVSNEPVVCLILYLLFKTGEYEYDPDDVCALRSGMKAEERTDVVDQFQQRGSGPKLMILSAKVGAVGITLTEATDMVMFDPTTVVADDLQVVKRIHRVGQTKVCTVWRFISNWESIETNMHEKRSQVELLAHMFMTMGLGGKEGETFSDMLRGAHKKAMNERIAREEKEAEV